MKILTLILSCLLFTQYLNAETISVKYRSSPVEVSNGNFTDYSLKESSIIKRLLYDQKENYLLVKLHDVYDHYCGIPANLVDNWVSAESLGKYYHANIKNKLD